MDTMITEEVYLKIEHAGKPPVISNHWVWDKKKFLATRQKEAKQEAVKNDEQAAAVSLVTRAEWLAHRWPEKRRA